MKARKINIPTGGVWEYQKWELQLHYERDEYAEPACKHVVGNQLPVIVVAKNEGGYNSTGVCGLCILEALKKYCELEGL